VGSSRGRAATTPTVTYLSDLTPTSAVNGWGPYQKDMSDGEQAASDGKTISIRGATFAKGLGVHALSDLRYSLPANCTSFNAIAGIDDEVAGRGSVDFQVYLDGAASPTYDSGVVTGVSPALPVAVDLTGHSQLRLVVAVGSTMDYDHADWADAKITCSSAADTTPPTVTAMVPAAGATGVTTGTAVQATFSEALE
jgi:NPCBM/NEW2 domain/Bacterial Ig-like domain